MVACLNSLNVQLQGRRLGLNVEGFEWKVEPETRELDRQVEVYTSNSSTMFEPNALIEFLTCKIDRKVEVSM